MKLNIQERIALLQILPAEGDIVTLRVLRDTQKMIGFSDEDLKKYNIVTKDQQVTWNTKGAKEVEIELGEKATEIIKEALLKLDKEKKLNGSQITIYEKFVQDKVEEAKK